MSTISNKPTTRTYFVGKLAANFPASTVFPPLNTAFTNETNANVTVNTAVYVPGQVELANGQIAVYNADTRLAVSAATVGTTVSRFFIAQGRDTSNDTASLQDRPFEQSEAIPFNAPIKIRVRECEIDRNSAWVIGAPAAATSGQINTTENVTYGATIAYRGHWAYRLNARNNPASFPNFMVEGTWTALGLATVTAQRDYIVQNFVHNINRMSRAWGNFATEPVFAFATSSVAATGVILNAIAVGDIVTIGYKNGNTANPIQVRITNGIFNAIAAAIASGKIAGTVRIVPTNTSTAGTLTADQILAIAMDRGIVDTDRVKFVKYRIDLGLNEGFGVATSFDRVSTDFEGFGHSRQVRLDYEDYAELNKMYRVQLPSGNAFQYPTDIVTNRAYLLVDIEWVDTTESSSTELTPEPHLITIALPCCDAATRTAWEALLNGFFKTLPNAKLEGPNVTAGSIDITPASTICASTWDAPFKTA
jgi:hypothetical protein